MLFWVVAACLTALACLAVLSPFARPAQRAASDVEHDIEVYKDQLAEVERDVARGVIETADADQARAEIGRRILKLAAVAPQAPSDRAGGMSSAARVIASVAVLSVPLISWGVYAMTGSPDLPAQPLQARLEGDPAQGGADALIARAEAHLAANPSDGRGWEVLAPIYLRMGRYPDAVAAYRNTIRLSGADAEREAGLAEALVANAGGLVTTDAQDAVERALALDPTHARARHMRAVAFAQDGASEEARDAWLSLRADVGEDAGWHQLIDRALSELERRQGETPPGPTQDEVAAAAELDDVERAEMIAAMVEGLDRRLSDEPDDVEGWLRLMQSYSVLGRDAEAQSAYRRAIAEFGTEGEDAERIAQTARALELTLQTETQEQ